ncbi:MAG: ribosome recycling factor [candidate division Zixibacteria bacterium 4484_95]|nr:MAG: ribosome recycling factor [candidate division Zixibacteria bacterium 4484_95]RKX18925.1 MAG: ribosome recycling factor [candidate division Zixibacteria bacterium]
MLEKIYVEAKEKMKKAVDAINRELAGIRTGRATPKILDGIKVEYYGALTPLKQLASITSPDPKYLVVQPWEKDVITDIVKAIQKADLGLNPIAEGSVVRLPIPPLNEERRREVVRLVKKIGEEGKISIRNIRREANDKIKKAQKDSDISEDDLERGQKRIQELTDDYISNISEIVSLKEQEIMEV